MSYYDPVVYHLEKRERVDFIVSERLREACKYRGYSYEEAANRCNIDKSQFGKMANGHVEIDKEYIFKLSKGLDFPKEFFYHIRWERT